MINKDDETQPALDVAVKQLKNNAAGSQDEIDFWAEMKLMKQIGRHDNVVSLVGVCTLADPALLVVEYADLGDLKGYLRNKRATATKGAQLDSTDMLRFCVQIANGMAYLASLKIVHRDLATRNVLVCKDELLKISDFGLARDVYEEDFYQKVNKYVWV